jgi:hypothetical protein
LGLLEPFDGTSFEHALSKVCQYATTYDKMSIGLLSIPIKVVQTSIQKCIPQNKNQTRANKHGTKFALSMACDLENLTCQ